MRVHDVVIIGAGPTGSYTACQLAENGFDVVAVEKNGSVAYPPACTGIIGLEAFERFHLPRDSIISEIKDISLFSPSGLSLAFRPESPLAFVVDRIKFDQGLRDRAIQKGAHIWFGTSCGEVTIRDTHIEVTVNDSRETIRAKALVIASGFNRELSEGLGLGKPSDYTQGVQTEVMMEGLEETEIYVGNGIAPGSFAWVVGIKDGRARVGLTTKRNASSFLTRFLESPFLKERVRERGPFFSKIIPIGSLQRTFSHRLLVIGEAAGQVKTTTHGGIYYGLISSQFAVETLQEAFTKGDFGPRIMKRYEREWKKAIDIEIKAGSRIRKFFSHLQDEQIERFFRIAMSDGVMDMVYKKARFDWHSDLIFSLIHHSLFKAIFGAMSGRLLSA